MGTPQSNILAQPKSRLYVVFLAVCALMTASTSGPDMWRLWHVAQAPGATVGVVTGLDCQNHGRVDYTLEVAGVTYPGAAHHVDDAPCQDLRVGERVNVSFELAAPENNFAFAGGSMGGKRAAHEFRKGLIMMIGFVFLGPLWLVLVAKVFLRVSERLSPRMRVAR
jgi:hypothetical protein